MPDKSDAVQLSGAGITARVEGNHILIIYVIISMGYCNFSTLAFTRRQFWHGYIKC